MGLFDFFSNIQEEVSRYADEGMEMPIEDLIYRMSRSTKKTQVMGYSNALKIKFKKLAEQGDTYQLESYFNMSFERGTHTLMGQNAMFPVMNNLGLAHKESGQIIRDYDY